MMVRTALSILVLALLAGLAAWAQGTPAENDDTRYSFSQVDEGYLRLDGRTGQVSVCTRRVVGWACQAVADERSALEAEIARLQGENVALKKDLLARNLPLPGTVKPQQPAAKPARETEPSLFRLPRLECSRHRSREPRAPPTTSQLPRVIATHHTSNSWPSA
jgi:hypothetical protein